jgi:hypothetical protein
MIWLNNHIIFYWWNKMLRQYEDQPNTIPKTRDKRLLNIKVVCWEKEGNKISEVPSTYRKKMPVKPYESYGTKKPFFYHANNIEIRNWCSRVAGRAMILAEKTRIRRYLIDKFIKGLRPVDNMEMNIIAVAMKRIEAFEVSEINESE